MKTDKKNTIISDFKRFLYHEALQQHVKQEEIREILKDSI